MAELRAIASGRGDLLAERAGELLGSREEDEPNGLWPHRALEAALCIAAGADLTLLTQWIEEGQRRSKRVR